MRETKNLYFWNHSRALRDGPHLTYESLGEVSPRREVRSFSWLTFSRTQLVHEERGSSAIRRHSRRRREDSPAAWGRPNAATKQHLEWAAEATSRRWGGCTHTHAASRTLTAHWRRAPRYFLWPQPAVYSMQWWRPTVASVIHAHPNFYSLPRDSNLLWLLPSLRGLVPHYSWTAECSWLGGCLFRLPFLTWEEGFSDGGDWFVKQWAIYYGPWVIYGSRGGEKFAEKGCFAGWRWVLGSRVFRWLASQNWPDEGYCNDALEENLTESKFGIK